MFGNPVSSGLTLTKVIGGISKTLNIANQVIPLYREAKPIIQNARTILGVLKGMGNNSNDRSNNIKTSNSNIKKDSLKESNFPKPVSINNPQFFL